MIGHQNRRATPVALFFIMTCLPIVSWGAEVSLSHLQAPSVISRLQGRSLTYAWKARSLLYPGGHDSAAQAVLGKETGAAVLESGIEIPSRLVETTSTGEWVVSGDSRRMKMRQELYNMSSGEVDLLSTHEVIHDGLYKRLSWDEKGQKGGEVRFANPLSPEINQREALPAWLAISASFLLHGGFEVIGEVRWENGRKMLKCLAGSNELKPTTATLMSAPMLFFLNPSEGNRLERYMLCNQDMSPIIVADIAWQTPDASVEFSFPASAALQIWQAGRLCEDIAVEYESWQVGPFLPSSDFALVFPEKTAVTDETARHLFQEAEKWVEESLRETTDAPE